VSTLPLWACGIIGAGVFFGLMFLKLHVGLSMMIGGFVGFWLTRGLPAAESTLAGTIFEVASSPILVIIPLFVLMGVIAGAGGVIGAAFKTFDNWLGHLRGGLAMATVGACAAFGAVCGDNIATAVTMNKAALPEMRKYGYHDTLSFGSIAAGGNLGILIPPSAAFVVYGFITENNIANLFVSGIVPGIILTVMFMATIAIWCRRNPGLSSPHEPVPMRARLGSLKGMIGILIVFFIVMGGLMGGVFTPQEAGAIGVVAMIIVSLFFRKLTWKSLGHALIESTRTSAMILLLIMGARYFSYFLTTTELATTLSDVIINANLNMYLVMIAVCILWIVLGMLMDIWSAMIITLPIFYGILIDQMGFDPLQLGVIVVLCIMLGCITPPVGVVVFSLAGMHRDVPMYTIFRGVWPFIYAMVIFLLLLIFVPWLSTWLPSLMSTTL
jgi:tripartite ATP-independent transporter DctM subunit